MTTQADLQLMPLYNIAAIIRQDWAKIHYGARPYVDAMGEMVSINERYHADIGRDVVTYFLANASTWCGDTARAIKAELKRRLAL